jgi:MFS family permease
LEADAAGTEAGGRLSSTSFLGRRKGMPALTHLNTRALVVLCLASAAWAFSFGLGAPLASLWLKDTGYDWDTVGYNTGVYYLGIALAAVFVPRLMRCLGPNCIVLGCLASALTVAVFPYSESLAGYFLARFANGIAAAMTLIPLETYINRDSRPEHRSRNFGFYALSIALGWALGTVVGEDMYTASPRLAFILGGVAATAAGVLIRRWLPAFADQEEERQGHAPLEFKRNILSFGSAWSQGFLEGGMVAFLALYLRDCLGLALERVGELTGGIMIGVIVFQVPVAWCADRLGRSRMLLACYAVVGVGLCLLPFCGDSIWLAVWLFLVGACSGAFYPLGLAILGERLPAACLARANAWFLAINCVGSLMGPSIMGEIMEWLGMRAMFGAGLAAILLVLAVRLVLRPYATWRGKKTRLAEALPAPAYQEAA